MDHLYLIIFQFCYTRELVFLFIYLVANLINALFYDIDSLFPETLDKVFPVKPNEN